MSPAEVELVGGPMDGTVLAIEEPEAPVLRFPAMGGRPAQTSRVYEYWASRARSARGRPVFRWGGEVDE